MLPVTYPFCASRPMQNNSHLCSVRAIPATCLRRPNNCLHQDSARVAWMGLVGALTHDPSLGPRHPYLSPCQPPHLHLAAAPLQLHVQRCVMCHASKEHNVTNWRQPKGKQKKPASEGQAWNVNRQSQGFDAYGKEAHRGDNRSLSGLSRDVCHTCMSCCMQEQA